MRFGDLGGGETRPSANVDFAESSIADDTQIEGQADTVSGLASAHQIAGIQRGEWRPAMGLEQSVSQSPGLPMAQR